MAQSLYFISLLIITLTTAQQITEPPVNTAVNIGNQAKLNCIATLGSSNLQWRHKLNYTDSLIWDSSDTDSIIDDRFDVDVDSAQNKYNLIIKSAQPEVGGQYYVKLGSLEETAELVVLGDLACKPSEPKTTQEGATIVLSCETGYYGYKDPVMKWYYQGKEITSQPYYSEDYDWKSVMSNFTAKPEHDGTIYECSLQFQPSDGDIGQPPVHYDNCTTATYIVYYSVRNVTIFPQPPEDGSLTVDIGDNLICAGIGNEPPAFDWYCHDRSYIIEGPILPITEQLVGEQTCICKAYNYVQGQFHEVEQNVTFIAGVSGDVRVTSSIFVTLFSVIVSMFAFSF